MGVFPHKWVLVTWGEPYVTKPKIRFRTQHPSPPTIQQNCCTGSSECTPKYHLTHHFLEIFQKWVGDLPRPLLAWENHVVAHRFFLPGVFSPVTPFGPCDFLGHWTLALVISSVTRANAGKIRGHFPSDRVFSLVTFPVTVSFPRSQGKTPRNAVVTRPRRRSPSQ